MAGATGLEPAASCVTGQRSSDEKLNPSRQPVRRRALREFWSLDPRGAGERNGELAEY